MSKNLLQSRQPMSDAAFVDTAAEWTKRMVSREARGPGDTENAMRRIEAKYGIPFSVLWSLRYRRPKGILSGTFARIRSAYEAECARQMRQLQHDLEITKLVAGPDHRAVRAAEALVGEEVSPEG